MCPNDMLCSAGTIPKELGELKNLQHLVLSSNHLTGELSRTICCKE